MKLFTLSFFTTLLGLSLAQANQLVFPTDLNTGVAPDYCNASTISCHWSGPVDSCCSPKYGLVVLALQWVENYGPSDEFTIHGLWPDTCEGKQGPYRGCDPSRRSNNIGNIVRGLNSTIYNRMNVFWPSYKGNNNWFWSHEWTKHGTCVSTLRPTCYGSAYTKYQDVLDYFEKVLDLRDKYDLFGALNLNGVPPGRTYNIQTMRDALEKSLGKRVKIDCRGGTLSEIVLYFYVKGAGEYVLTDALVPGSCRGAVNYPRK